jgi:predicted GNAT family N-acyltransferase
MGTARTFVWLQWNMEVVAYFSLCPHQVRRDEVPPQLGHGAPDAIPAILLARLALSVSLHRQELGGELLTDALARAVDGVRAVGGRLIVVDAISDEAGAFYKHFGFQSIPEAPHRIFRKASDVEAALRGSGPGTPKDSK